MPRGLGPIREAGPRDMPPHAARAMPQRRPQERYDRPPPMDMPPQRMQGPPPAGDATGILKLRGLPFSASREDVAMWFNESGALFQPIDADWWASAHLLNPLCKSSPWHATWIV